MQSKKSILFILPKLSHGGAERQSVTIARLLAREGYDVRFLTYFDSDAYLELLEEVGIRVDTILSNGFWRIIKVFNYIHRGQFNTIISFMQTPNFLNNISSLLGKKWKVITSIRATPRSEEVKSFQGKIYGWFYRKSDVIVCNSLNTQKVFGALYPSTVKKLTTIYNAVQLGRVTTDYCIKRNGKVNIVIAATVSNIKNPLGLLNALSLMNEEEKNLLHIDWYGKRESVIGDHTEYDKVIYLIKSNHLQDVISLHESTKEIASKMNEADCVALFSRLEGLPNAICEGMMLGKPIIMTKCSDYSVLVEEGKNGFLCYWDNPKSIKDALLKMANLDKCQLEVMGNESREKANRLFSENSISKQWIKVIQDS